MINDEPLLSASKAFHFHFSTEAALAHYEPHNWKLKMLFFNLNFDCWHLASLSTAGRNHFVIAIIFQHQLFSGST